MHIVTTQEKEKLIVSALYWRLDEILPQDIYKLWQTIVEGNNCPNTFFNFPCRITQNKISKLKHVLHCKQGFLLESINRWLKRIITSNRYRFGYYDWINCQERLIGHLVCLTLGYKSHTDKNYVKMSIPCRLVAKEKSFPKAVKNYVEYKRNECCYRCGYNCECNDYNGYGCGCAYIPKDVCKNHHAVLAKKVPYLITWEKHYDRRPVVQQILDASSPFPKEVNIHICSFL